MKFIDNIPVWGDPQPNAVEQMKNALKSGGEGALMADHHLGYSVPVGGVIAYSDKVSPSGVGFDIACGNKAVLTDAKLSDIRRDIKPIMDDIFRSISFGVGRVNNEKVDHELFESSVWKLESVADQKQKAEAQLGTVGSGNHYVDIFHDEQERIWIGVHFGSRGLGHHIASHYIKAGGGKDGIDVAPVIMDVDSELGIEYLRAMGLAGKFAYAGRDWVCERVVRIIGANILDEVHNHHNFTWLENHGSNLDPKMLWITRKGATPAFPRQRGFVGGTMFENAVILEGVETWTESKLSFHSTVHGAGRVLSRSQAAGSRKARRKGLGGGCVTPEMMKDWQNQAGVELRGGDVDESPHCYKRLNDVLLAHANTVKILNVLTPIGVAMAGRNEYDPYKD
jgi:tRNA-splicing ligase RtcB